MSEPTGDSEELSAQQAAALLGVKLPTLYAYVSRGLLRSQPSARGRSRSYPRADVEALRRHGRGAVAGALRWGEPLLDTQLTELTAAGPRYRGRAAVVLAEEGTPFEAVAELLWSGALPDPSPSWTAGEPPLEFSRLSALLPRHASPSVCLSLLVAAAAAHDPGRFDSRRAAVTARARTLIRLLAAGLALPGDPERAERAFAAPSVAEAVAMATGVGPQRAAKPLLDRALVLLADHELNASTFAARVTASTDADIYAVVQTGLATLSGPRHGAASDQVEALLAEVERPAEALHVLHERARRGEGIPGFGHGYYRQADPRAPAMLEPAFELAGESASLRTLAALIEAMAQDARPAPNVDVGLVAVRAALGMPRGTGAGIFAVARCAGWVAHTLEQQASGQLLRPRARYVGP